MLKNKFMKEKQLKYGDLIKAHNYFSFSIGFYIGEDKNNVIKFIKLWFANDKGSDRSVWLLGRLNNPSEEIWFETL